ncbi:fused MFS/spermidine synthase [Caballeronia sp. LZ065]|uniref:fused MFS/spermidine synthase n=1 Tax=Caballeronia sp. LZ065 TaxID=3038571 RepID=UPI00285F3595|nr:fused MFS/spermidine synthase [Caballeronia sp. LZ065]MDR5781584.1 fused MFS/spermidine synthase [Caballeronia sp. LZ065]
MSHLSADHPKSNRRAAASETRRAHTDDTPVAQRTTVPALLLFASGMAALIYQVLWVKQLTLVVGIEVQAITIAIGAFFAGLAIGGWCFGKLADRVARPFLLYAALEIAALLLGIGATHALAHSAASFATLQASAGPLAWALPFALVGLPAIAMGGTVPVLTRALAPSRRGVGGTGGRLYAANTAGAITGALLPAFLLIPLLGVQGSALAAAGLNAVAALGAMAIARHAPPSLAADAPNAHSPADAGRARVAVALYAVAGGIALGYEIVWSQAIAQFISTRSFAFSIVLATYLLGLALGSAIAARWVDRVRDPWSAFGVLIGLAGLAALGGVAGAGGWLTAAQRHASALALAATGNLLTSMCASFAVAASAIVLVPTLLLGAAFPFALRMVANGHADRAKSGIGADVGRVLALNTAGGIAGTLFAGFELVPSLGLIRSLGVLAVAAALIGLSAALSGNAARRAGIVACASIAALSVIVAIVTPADRLGALLAKAHGGSLAYYEESAGGTVAVLERGDGPQRFRRLYIQGVSNSGDAMTSRRYMRLQALAPLMAHTGTPRSALVIGLGTGITGGALLTWPTLEKRVVAELLPSVVRASARFDGNFGMSADPRIDLRVADGRRELLARSEHYDLVTLEPPPPSAAGVVNLYSTDFYRLAAARLNEGGIVAQWLPLATQNEDQTRSLIQSFLRVFPHAALWTTEFHEMMLVGSMLPMPLDVPRLRARFAQPDVARALREVGIASPEAFAATWVADRSALAYYAEDARPVTDDDPSIEYAPWVRRGDFPVTLARLLALQSEPPLTRADAAFTDTLAAERRTLHTFYRAGLDAYRGDRDAWTRDIGAVMQADRTNPYYRWVIGTPD